MDSTLDQKRNYALKFDGEQEFRLALELLDRLAVEGPIEYRIIGGYKTVLSRWTYDKLAPLLNEVAVKYARVKMTSMSDLPPSKEAVLRGLRQNRS